MDYYKAVDYINSFINFEQIPRYEYVSSFKLERMHFFLEQLGNPHRRLNTIHVAGSKGKGSTCIILANILREAGYCAGLYTSPHLIDVRERIRVWAQGVQDLGDSMIEKEELVGLIERIKPVAERFRDHKKLGKLSFFEILTACAFLYFGQKKVDFAVLETGLGGRLDATNVVYPMVCGITNISLEHTDKLGNSLASIAREKAGIIKARDPGSNSQAPVVSVPQEREALAVIRDVSREKNASLYEIGKDIVYSVVYLGEGGLRLDIEGPGYRYKNLQLNLIGRHQAENVALAIGMIKFLDRKGYSVKEDAIRAGLKSTLWPGRLQVIRKRPTLILDGAQNVASIKTALFSIEEIFSYQRLICIFGISSDKDIQGVSRELDNVCDVVILTKSSNIRAEKPAFLQRNFYTAETVLSADVKDALNKAFRMADKDDLILVTGSLYLVGEVIQITRGPGLGKV